METQTINGKKTHFVLAKNDSNNADEPRDLTIPIEDMFNFFAEKGDMRIYNYF